MAGLGRANQIGLAKHWDHLNTCGLSAEQKAAEQLLIKTRLSQRNHHQHLIHIGQGRTQQLGGAGLEAGHRSATITPITALQADPVPNHHLLAAVGQTGASGAEQLTFTGGTRLQKAHPQVVGLKGHHTAPQWIRHG